jgi:uncharacterized membrane protein
MTDQNPAPRGNAFLDPGKDNVQVIYYLYLVSLLVGITGLVAIVLAYMNRGKSEPWLETHYTWAIRTFWIGLAYSFAAVILVFLVIGFFLFIAVAIWFIARCVIGLQALGRNEPVKNPESWFF